MKLFRPADMSQPNQTVHPKYPNHVQPNRILIDQRVIRRVLYCRKNYTNVPVYSPDASQSVVAAESSGGGPVQFTEAG